VCHQSTLNIHSHTSTHSQYEEALRLYIFKVKDDVKAIEYCVSKQHYTPAEDPHFDYKHLLVLLLRIYVCEEYHAMVEDDWERQGDEISPIAEEKVMLVLNGCVRARESVCVDICVCEKNNLTPVNHNHH
jgi:hypothetical protein